MSVLPKVVAKIQDADAALQSGNGGPTRDQVYQARQALREAVLLAVPELEQAGKVAASW